MNAKPPWTKWKRWMMIFELYTHRSNKLPIHNNDQDFRMDQKMLLK